MAVISVKLQRRTQRRRSRERMTDKEFDELKSGDIVQSARGQGWIVSGNYKKLGVVMVRTLLAHNSSEWKLIQKAGEGEND